MPWRPRTSSAVTSGSVAWSRAAPTRGVRRRRVRAPRHGGPPGDDDGGQRPADGKAGRAAGPAHRLEDAPNVAGRGAATHRAQPARRHPAERRRAHRQPGPGQATAPARPAAAGRASISRTRRARCSPTCASSPTASTRRSSRTGARGGRGVADVAVPDPRRRARRRLRRTAPIAPDIEAVAFYTVEKRWPTSPSTPAPACQVSLSLVGDRLRLAVVDDGTGFPSPAAGSVSGGLTNIRDRVTAVGGRAEVTGTRRRNPGGRRPAGVGVDGAAPRVAALRTRRGSGRA